MKNKKGFTLVELLAVIAILAILVIMALPAVLRMFEQARVDTFNNELNTIIRTAKQQYLLDGGVAKSWSNAEGSTDKLSMTGHEDITYYIEMDGNGKIIKLLAENGTYQCKKTGEIDIISSSDIQKISELTGDDIIIVAPDGLDRFTCDAKTYLPKGASACVTCPANSYCVGGTYAYNETDDQGKEACPSGFSSDVGGAGQKNDCYVYIAAGKERRASTSATVYNCNVGSASQGRKSYYGSSDYCTRCPNGKYATGQGASTCTSCPSGYTTSGYYYCDQLSSNSTGAYSSEFCYVDVPANKYKTSATGSALADCPSGTTSIAHKSYYNVADNSCSPANSERYTCSNCTISGNLIYLRSNDTITFTAATKVDIYMVGGGGGGASAGFMSGGTSYGSYAGSGGGGGGATLLVSNYTATGKYIVKIGTGGNGGSTSGSQSALNGSDGGKTEILRLQMVLWKAAGGGGGKISAIATTGGTGGSAGSSTTAREQNGTRTNGGKGGSGGYNGSSYNSISYKGENGGAGNYAFSTTSYGAYGAGGGGGAHSWSNGSTNCISSGGSNVGGKGATTTGSGLANSAGTDGNAAANTGSGGGGAAGGPISGSAYAAGGNGGSGIVIIRIR